MKIVDNLHQFIELLKQRDDIHIIDTEVDSHLEITEITDRISKEYGKALLFTNVKGSKFPVLINAFGTYERLNLALGVNELDDIAKEIESFMNFGNYQGLGNQMKMGGQLLKMAGVLPKTGIAPKKVKNAPCQEVIEEPKLTEIPVLQCWPDDGGRFITLGLTITKDPENGQQNMGMYRLQVYDDNRTGMHWHLHKDGREIYDKYKKMGIKKMPVSVILGADPATIYSATAPLPKMIYELLFAGFLRKAPVEVVKCITNDIYVPAHAEFVLEGYVDIDEDLKLEGPFGDHTGYYSIADMYPVFHVEKITRRKNAIYPTTVVGQPPQEDCYIAVATERIFLPLMKLFMPELVDMHMPLEGVFHNCAIVSAHKAYPKQAQKMMMAMWGMGQMMYEKMIIICDAEDTPKDVETIMYKAFNEVSPVRDYVVTEGPLDALDHSSPTAFYGHRLGIDVTKKVDKELQDVPNLKRKQLDNKDIDAKVLEIIKNKYPEIVDIKAPTSGIFNNVILVSFTKTQKAHGKNLLTRLFNDPLLKEKQTIIVADANIDLNNDSLVFWKFFNNIDANRDLIREEIVNGDTVTYHLGIDVTKKNELDDYFRVWPDDIVMSDDVKEMVAQRWSEYGFSKDNK